MRKRRGRRRGANRGAMLGISAVVAVLLVSLTFQSRSLMAKNSAYEQKEAGLEQQLEAEMKRTEEISGLEEYMKTDEYVEKIARDKLGLVYPDEILIKPEE